MVVYNVIKNTKPSAKSGVIGSHDTGKVKLQHSVTVSSANCILKYADSNLCYGDCVKKLKNPEFCLCVRSGGCDEDCLEKYQSVDYCKCIKKGTESNKCKKNHLTEHFALPYIDYDDFGIKVKIGIVIVLLAVLIISYLFKKKIFV